MSQKWVPGRLGSRCTLMWQAGQQTTVGVVEETASVLPRLNLHPKGSRLEQAAAAAKANWGKMPLNLAAQMSFFGQSG